MLCGLGLGAAANADAYGACFSCSGYLGLARVLLGRSPLGQERRVLGDSPFHEPCPCRAVAEDISPRLRVERPQGACRFRLFIHRDAVPY